VLRTLQDESSMEGANRKSGVGKRELRAKFSSFLFSRLVVPHLRHPSSVDWSLLVKGSINCP